MTLREYALSRGLDLSEIVEESLSSQAFSELCSLGTETPCGKDCVEVIDAAVPLLQLLSFPESQDQVKQAVVLQLSVLYFG